MRILLLLLGFLLSADLADAAIARNAATSKGCTSAENPCALSHTVAGSEPVLEVCVAWYHYLNPVSITGVTWGGLPLTQKGTAVNTNCGGVCGAALYYLANPGAATADVSVAFSGSFNDAMISAVSYTGVNTGNPVGSEVTATGVGTPASVTVPSSSNEVVTDCLSSGATGPVPTAASSQTSNANFIGAQGYQFLTNGYVAGAPLTVAQYTLNYTSTAPQWAMVGLNLKPGGSGGGGGTTPTGTQRVISWNDNSNNETCFHLQWRTDQSTPNWIDLQTCLPQNTTSYPHNIGSATGDCYRIRSENAGGTQGYTNEVCAAAPAPPDVPPNPNTIGVPAPMTFIFEEDLL